MPNPIENFAAKVAGKTAAVEARLKGLKGVFNKLAEQHHALGSLLSRAESAEDPTSRAALWHEIRKELVSHEQAELLEIYPALAGNERTRAIAVAHADGASELEALIEEVDRMPPQTSDWKPALARLRAKVKEHVEIEETQYFPAAQAALGERAAKQLEAPFLAAKEMAMAKLA
ncbi:MAG TPA: hemerythrin domain-containing protein [Polyangiaceae bacterium]